MFNPRKSTALILLAAFAGAAAQADDYRFEVGAPFSPASLTSTVSTNFSFTDGIAALKKADTVV